MDCVVMEPIGVVTSDLSLRAPTPDLVGQLRRLLAEHGVLIVRGQHLDDPEFVQFLTSFGRLTFTPGETPVEGFPDLNIVSNLGRDTPPRSTFHVDSSYLSQPPSYTALRAVRIPAVGGQTLFTNQYRAYETLRPELRDRLDGRLITHEVTGIDLTSLDAGAETTAEHPVFRTHPISGRTAIYLSTPQRCTAISGLDAEESARTVEELFGHSTAEDNTYRHTWAPGDVVMWDNACVMHRADHDGVVGDRVMHRGMVVGYGPPSTP